MKVLFRVLIFSCFIFLISCTKDEDNSSNTTEGFGFNVGEFSSACGVVIDNEIINPAPSTEGLVVNVVSTTSNSAVVRGETGQQFEVKFSGLAPLTNSNTARIATNALDNFSSRAIFFEAKPGCVASIPGGIAREGQLYTLDGESYNETLISIAAAEVSPVDTCGLDELNNCYADLFDSVLRNVTRVTNFLWKPRSEKDGNLVILLNPAGARILVNGESLTDFGISNGRGTTARADKPGADFGTNILIQAFDRDNRPLMFSNGTFEFSIANGAERVSFE